MEKEILQQEKAVDVAPTTSLQHFKKFKDTTDCKAENFFLHPSFKNLPHASGSYYLPVSIILCRLLQ